MSNVAFKNHLKTILINKAYFFKRSIVLKDLMSTLDWGHGISGFASGRSVSNILQKTEAEDRNPGRIPFLLVCPAGSWSRLHSPFLPPGAEATGKKMQRKQLDGPTRALCTQPPTRELLATEARRSRGAAALFSVRGLTWAYFPKPMKLTEFLFV